MKQKMIHLQITLILNLPLMIIINRLDIAKEENIVKIFNKIKSYLSAFKRTAVIMQNQDCLKDRQYLLADKVPVFISSCKSGAYLDILKQALFEMSLTHVPKITPESRFEFLVDSVYKIPETGIVLVGDVTSGSFNLTDSKAYRIGPDVNYEFFPLKIISLHHQKQPVNFAQTGDRVAFGVNCLGVTKLKKGMVIVEESSTDDVFCDSMQVSMSIVWRKTSGYIEQKGALYVRGFKYPATVISHHNENNEFPALIKISKKIQVKTGLTCIYACQSFLGVGKVIEIL